MGIKKQHETTVLNDIIQLWQKFLLMSAFHVAL